jgi:hypothetical protein
VLTQSLLMSTNGRLEGVMQMGQLTHVTLGVMNDSRRQKMADIFIKVYVPAMDFVFSHLSCHFDDSILHLMCQIMTFSAGSFLGKTWVTASDVNIFCDKCQVDVDKVVRELNSFIPVFQASHTLLSMDDVSVRVNSAAPDASSNATDSSLWIRQTFLHPYRLLHLLSSFPTLLTVYKILVTIAVTSTSVERAMSKVKLVKTRLWSTMTDEYFLRLGASCKRQGFG